jgi:hypothetical protein
VKFRNEYKNRPGGGADGRMPGAVRISKSRPGDAVRQDLAYILSPLRLGVVVPGSRGQPEFATAYQEDCGRRMNSVRML